MKADEKEVNIAGWGTPSQSAVLDNENPQNALDRNPSTITHTPSQTDPWWTLDLLKVYTVTRVVITNRNSWSERINGAEIRVGNVSDAFSNPICAVIPSIPEGASSNFPCNRMAGRYVSVVIRGIDRYLTLAEVEVYVVYPDNLAAGRSVTQSSNVGSWTAEQAIDFNPGFFPQPSLACSSTDSQTNPWWRLDLGQIYRVSRVVVTNRRDCCPERINGAEIRIGNSLDNNGNNNPVCAVISSIPAGDSSTYTCNGMEGRYVNLIIPGDSRILTLCEVQVYGEVPH
ncbi:fucolectin-6-like [Pseudorasbora parva]|uniref:fucolectin-6-like n=1 Tax=Pseudorasbora parva TaxID=51549 RepID=UPI00351DF95E